MGGRGEGEERERGRGGGGRQLEARRGRSSKREVGYLCTYSQHHPSWHAPLQQQHEEQHSITPRQHLSGTVRDSQ
jgi:hypothetical protein